MNRTVLKRWFDKLPALPWVYNEITPNRLKIVTWEELIKLGQKIEYEISTRKTNMDEDEEI